MSNKWTQKEIDTMFNYIEADDSDTIEEAFEFAAYMLHFESGLDFPERTKNSIRSKFYQQIKSRKLNSGEKLWIELRNNKEENV